LPLIEPERDSERLCMRICARRRRPTAEKWYWRCLRRLTGVGTGPAQAQTPIREPAQNRDWNWAHGRYQCRRHPGCALLAASVSVFRSCVVVEFLLAV